MKVQEMIDLLVALEDGRTIQYRAHKHINSKDVWGKVEIEHFIEDCFDLSSFEYRIKPEPRTFYLNTVTGMYTTEQDSHHNQIGEELIKVREVLE